MKKFLSVVIAFALLSGCAYGGSLFVSNGTDENNNPADVEFDDGLHVELIGAYVYGSGKDYVNPNNKNRIYGQGSVSMVFMVTSAKDTTLDISTSELFDNRGGKFEAKQKDPWGHQSGWGTRIGGYWVNRQDIIAEVPVIVMFTYDAQYDEQFREQNLRTVSHVKCTFSGHELEYRKIPMQNWKACTEKMNSLGFSVKEWFDRNK